MTKRYLGNIITQNPTAPVGTARPSTVGSAKGVWSLNEALAYQKAGQWPYPVFAPDAPTIGTATAGNATATVPFTAPSEDGGLDITQYTATSSPGSITGTASSSPVTVTGLTNDVAYTFTVTATNPVGTGPASSASNSVSPEAPIIGLFAGGNQSGLPNNAISQITIATTGNGTDFGDLTIGRESMPAAMGSATRGVFAGGIAYNTGGRSNIIDYVTFASAGNATDFGDATAQFRFGGGMGNSTRGIFALGQAPSTGNRVDYITIASTGNAADYGNLTFDTSAMAGCASTTRGLFGGGEGPEDVIQYTTIASTGNFIDFGDLANSVEGLAAFSSSTRGVFGGGDQGAFGRVNTIGYVTIASTGNATDFGDLIVATEFLAGCSSSTRGLFGGGLNTPDGLSNAVSYVTISSTGNATDFGDLSFNADTLTACSNAHGGIS